MSLDMELTQTYQKLKENICIQAGDKFDLNKVKSHFESEIATKRARSKIHSLSDLFTLLEERDSLCANNVSCISDLGVLLNNSRIKDFVHAYQKLNGDSQSMQCLFCSNSSFVRTQPQERCFNDSQVFNSPVYETRCPPTYIQPSDQLPDLLELEIAIKNISRKIGDRWPILLRELDLTEAVIHQIRKGYNDVHKQAEKGLEVWRAHKGENATVALLDSALNSRLCKLKGLGSHLRISEPQINLA